MTEAVTDTSTDVATDEFTFPKQRGCPFHAENSYAPDRKPKPIERVTLPSGFRPWLLTRHEDVRAMLADPRFSADRRKDDFPVMVRGQFALRDRAPSMIIMDGAEHSVARRSVISEFSVRRIAALEPRIQQIVDDLIDDMLAGDKPADLVTALSLPVPSMVICEMLGIPYEDHDFFQTRTAKLLKRHTGEQERYQLTGELRDYLEGLLHRKAAADELPDDLLGRQIGKQLEETGTVDYDGLVSMAQLLLIAGHETTANMISLGTLALLRNPEQLATITADPAQTPLAVEEMLRFFSITEGITSRLAMEDVEIGGHLIRAGEGVLGDVLAANRDTDSFGDDPEELDLSQGKRHHVAFGFGPHQCLGQNLARKELQIVFDTLLRRVPTLKLAAEVDDVPFKDDTNIYGIYQLPVTW